MTPQPRTVRQPRRALVTTALVTTLAATLVAGCGDDGGAPAASPDTRCEVARGGAVTIVAEDIAWDVACLRAPEGRALSVTVDNRDAGVNHNLRVDGLAGKPATELEVGPVTQVLALPAGLLRTGAYGFVCDIHPNMTGTLEIVETATTSPEGTVAPPR